MNLKLEPSEKPLSSFMKFAYYAMAVAVSVAIAAGAGLLAEALG